jgi:hypothetical protein
MTPGLVENDQIKQHQVAQASLSRRAFRDDGQRRAGNVVQRAGFKRNRRGQENGIAAFSVQVVVVTGVNFLDLDVHERGRRVIGSLIQGLADLIRFFGISCRKGCKQAKKKNPYK